MLASAATSSRRRPAVRRRRPAGRPTSSGRSASRRRRRKSARSSRSMPQVCAAPDAVARDARSLAEPASCERCARSARWTHNPSPTEGTQMSSQQRIALITGGNRGIGRATALALAADGVDSVITYATHAEEADAVVAELEALGRKSAALQLDTGDSARFEAFAATLADTLQATWGRDSFDYLVNNAGNSSSSSFTEVTED